MQQSSNVLLILHNRLLLELSQFIGGSEIWGFSDVAQKIITAALAGLNVSRASIWRLNDTIDTMECMALSIDGEFVDVENLRLIASDYPRYFNALVHERFIVADDAHTHLDTCEFSEGYLTPLNIFSMLDAPIRKNGKIVGILCCEQTEHPRTWSLLEQSFAAILSDAAGRALAEEEARKALYELEFAAHTDPLTNLYNRLKLIDDLTHMSDPSLVIFDIDGFTDINDYYGYEVGNFVLKELGKNILLLASGKGSLYRYNSDKFALLINNSGRKEFLLVESILDHTDIYTYAINDFIIPLKLSAAVSFESTENIIQSLDILLKELKKQNRHLMIYDKSLGLEAQI